MLDVLVSCVALIAAQPEGRVPAWGSLPSPVRAAIQDHLADVVLLPSGECVDLWAIAERERVWQSSITERDNYEVVRANGMRFRRRTGSERVLAQTAQVRAWKIRHVDRPPIPGESGIPVVEGVGTAEWRDGKPLELRGTRVPGDPSAWSLVYFEDVADVMREMTHVEGSIFELGYRRVEVPRSVRGECFLWLPSSADENPVGRLVTERDLDCSRDEAVEAIADGRLVIQTWKLENRNGSSVWVRGDVIDDSVIQRIPEELAPIDERDLPALPTPDLPNPPGGGIPQTIDPVDNPAPRDPLKPET